MSVAVAVSRGPVRKAAQSGGSTVRKTNATGRVLSVTNGPNATAANALAAVKMAIDSKTERRSNDRGRSTTHSTRTGVIVSTAAKSPSHNRDHAEAHSSQSTRSMPGEA